jgi:hypothetical protein
MSHKYHWWWGIVVLKNVPRKHMIIEQHQWSKDYPPLGAPDFTPGRLKADLLICKV